MPDSTAAPRRGNGVISAASTGPDSFRVIAHPPVCPACASPDVTTEDIDITDDTTETAYLCRACGEAWPMACVTDWTLSPATGRR